jgi:ubiquinone/menaquinone biosynthesis C-methylase UbiE
MSLWSDRILPELVERACRSRAILEERRRCVPHAAGRVLEVGVGSGLNLGLYEPERVERLTAIDPSVALLRRARERASRLPLPVELLEASAEALPFAGASFDAVVMTYTLCSVADPAKVLSEIARVLRPGGRLHYIEHGLAEEPSSAAWQRRLTPLWRRVSGNCHLDRDIRAELDASVLRREGTRAAHADGPRWLSFTVEGEAVRPGAADGDVAGRAS